MLIYHAISQSNKMNQLFQLRNVQIFFSLICGTIFFLECASSTQVAGKAGQTTPSTNSNQSNTALTNSVNPPNSAINYPVELRINELTVDPAKTVRIKGVIASVKAMRLVPPTVIFTIFDSSETITAVINEQIMLKEGTKIELVGKYKEIASPTRAEGNAETPREAVFVVERYFDLQ